jgi:hypothetical protein
MHVAYIHDGILLTSEPGTVRRMHVAYIHDDILLSSEPGTVRRAKEDSP